MITFQCSINLFGIICRLRSRLQTKSHATPINPVQMALSRQQIAVRVAV